MIHPIAEQARQKLDTHLFAVARQLLNDALARGENHPDLLCEHLICESYFGNEEAASLRFSETKSAPRHHDLQLLLSRYFYCRQLLSRKLKHSDLPADDWLTQHPYQPEPGVGIKISACLITKNEENNLAKCFDSLQGVVDEIVVVDTGSADKTVEIAQRYGATIGWFDWINDFSAARNHALSLATGEWVLWIDADEQLDPSCQAEFRKGIVRSHIGGYSIEIVNYLDDSGCTSEFVHSPTRLFRRLAGVHFTEPIHEQITPSLMALYLPWTPLPGARIHHDGYRKATIDEKNKVQRTLEILEGVIAKNPEDPFHLFNLANTYFVAADYERAALTAELSIRYMPKAGAEYGHADFQVLVTSLSILERHEEALKVCDQCDLTTYGGISNEYLRGSILLDLGRYEEAMVACEKCLKLSWPENCIGDKGIADFRRYGLYAQLLGCLGKWQESLVAFEDALSRQPGFLPATMGRGIAYENLGELDKAEADYLVAIKEPRNIAMCSRGLGAIAESRKDFVTACSYFEQGWNTQTNNSALWNQWVTCLENLGDLNLIDRAYQQFLGFNNASSGLYVNWARVSERFGVLDRALDHYQSALNLDPSDTNAAFSCGDLLYKLGAYPQAAQMYEIALRLRSDYADGWFVLGNCLAQMNHDDAAVKCYSQALVLDPRHEKAQANLQVVAQAA